MENKEKLLKLATGTLKSELKHAGVEWDSVDEQKGADNFGVDVFSSRKRDVQAAMVSLASHIAKGGRRATFSPLPPHGDSIHADQRDAGIRLVMQEWRGKHVLRFDVMVKTA